METNFRAFFLLVETIIEIRQNSVFKNIPAKESSFMVRETNFLTSGNHFFLYFSETPVSFFFLVEKYF